MTNSFGNITGSVVNIGNNNTVSATITVTPPPADTVDMAAEVAELRALVEVMNSSKAERMLQAFSEVAEDVADEDADKGEIAGALERGLKIAAKAEGYLDKAEAIQEKVTKIAGWLGPYAAPVLAAVGLSL